MYAFVTSILSDPERQIPEWATGDREDLHAELVAVCWQLSLDFDYEKANGETFARYANRILRFRVVDFIRKTRGRTKWEFRHSRFGYVYERPEQKTVSFDAIFSDEEEPGELERTLTRSDLDVAEDRSPDLTRALRARGSRPAGRGNPLGQRQTRRAA